VPGSLHPGTVEYAAPEVLADLGSAVGNPGGGVGRGGKTKVGTTSANARHILHHNVVFFGVFFVTRGLGFRV